MVTLPFAKSSLNLLSVLFIFLAQNLLWGKLPVAKFQGKNSSPNISRTKIDTNYNSLREILFLNVLRYDHFSVKWRTVNLLTR